jgi:hypothetical protein
MDSIITQSNLLRKPNLRIFTELLTTDIDCNLPTGLRIRMDGRALHKLNCRIRIHIGNSDPWVLKLDNNFENGQWKHPKKCAPDILLFFLRLKTKV